MALETGEIEISIDVTFVGSLHINVKKTKWAAMSHTDRVATIAGAIDSAAIKFCNDVSVIEHGVTVSHEITGPMDSEITSEMISVYDPEA